MYSTHRVGHYKYTSRRIKILAMGLGIGKTPPPFPLNSQSISEIKTNITFLKIFSGQYNDNLYGTSVQSVKDVAVQVYTILIFVPVSLRIRYTSGLEPVLCNTEKLCLATLVREFFF